MTHRAFARPGCAAIVAALSIVLAPAANAWPLASSPGVLVSTSTAIQGNPAITSDGAHGAYVLWLEQPTAGVPTVHAQRLDPLGAIPWATDGIEVSGARCSLDPPRLVSDGAGGAIALWRDFRADTAGDLYAQRLHADGTTAWGATGVAVTTGVLHERYSVAIADGAGGLLVAWQDDREGATQIRVQRVGPDGAILWSAGGVRPGTSAQYQSSPTLGADGSGGAYVMWTENFPYEGRMQHLDASGALLWSSAGELVTSGATWQGPESLVPDGTGGVFAVVSANFSNVPFTQVYVQYVDATGAPHWGTGGSSVSGADLPTFGVHACADGSHGLFIEWERYLNDGTGNAELRMRRVDSAGNGLAGSGRIVGLVQSGYGWFSSSMIPDGAGGTVLAWTDQGPPLGQPVFAQRIDGALDPQWGASAVPLAQSSGVGYRLALTSDGAQGAIAVWLDEGASYQPHPYAAHVAHSGATGPLDVSAPPPAKERLLAAAPSLVRRGETVTFQITHEPDGDARVGVFDAAGRRVRTLRAAAGMAGTTHATWDGRDDAGRNVEPGVYLARLEGTLQDARTRVVVTH